MSSREPAPSAARPTAGISDPDTATTVEIEAPFRTRRSDREGDGLEPAHGTVQRGREQCRIAQAGRRVRQTVIGHIRQARGHTGRPP
ncbi:hypothetical protein [Nocardia testacea]|uniref:hypothetical protein n=1 Tax=Nocardia testacea TaxID=248551 RepID=UPI003A870DBF